MAEVNCRRRRRRQARHEVPASNDGDGGGGGGRRGGDRSVGGEGLLYAALFPWREHDGGGLEGSWNPLRFEHSLGYRSHTHKYKHTSEHLMKKIIVQIRSVASIPSPLCYTTTHHLQRFSACCCLPNNDDVRLPGARADRPTTLLQRRRENRRRPFHHEGCAADFFLVGGDSGDLVLGVLVRLEPSQSVPVEAALWERRQ